MERVRADGPTSVAALLRRMADGAETGAIPVGDRLIPCADDLAAVVEVPEDGGGQILVISLRLTSEHELFRPIALEEELAHPGG